LGNKLQLHGYKGVLRVHAVQGKGAPVRLPGDNAAHDQRLVQLAYCINSEGFSVGLFADVT